MDRRHFLIVSLAAGAPFVLGASASAQGAAKPSDIVRRIYTFSAGKSGAWDGPSAVFDDGMRKATLTKAFRDAITEEAALLNDEVGALDFDPVSNSQDPAVFNLSISDAEVGPAKARVVAQFRRGAEATAEQTQVVYHLVLEAGQWRVDDIVPSGDDGSELSVRKALAESIAERKAATLAPAPVKQR